MRGPHLALVDIGAFQDRQRANAREVAEGVDALASCIRNQRMRVPEVDCALIILHWVCPCIACIAQCTALVIIEKQRSSQSAFIPG